MEMYWNLRGELRFRVHLKPNQKLKYLNNDSTHLPSTFRAIPSGVLNRLSKLTSKSQSLEDTKLDKAYPHHAKALQIAGIAPKVFPTFKELETLRNLTTKEERENLKREKEKRRKRQTFFCIGVSQCSMRTNKHPPMHAVIKKLRDKYNLKWLRIAISYHKFPSLGQAFMGDLTTKLTRHVKSRDFEDLPCNCNRASKIDGLCMFGGDCRKAIVVYKTECRDCNMVYIGNTQQKLKVRITQHLNEICSLVNNDKTSDSFAKHFAKHFQNRQTKLTAGEARKHLKVTIMWQGKAISCNKTFGKLTCSLCMKERLLILKLSQKDPAIIINSSAEFYGACRHRPRFHRYLPNCTTHSTDDEHSSSERVDTRDLIDSQNPQNSLGTICTNLVSDGNLNLCRPCTTIGPDDTGISNDLAVNQNTSFVDV